MSMEQALDKINVLEAQNKIITAELTAAKSERDQANSVLNAQIRAKYMDKLRAIGTLPETTLHRMSNDQLENEIAVLERNKRSNPKSILFSADQANRNEGLIDLYTERVKRGRD
jgi:hypothetical protein